MLNDVRDRARKILRLDSLVLLAKVARGRFGASLASVVKAQAALQLRSNSAVKAHRYSRIKRLAAWSEQHPYRSIVAVLFVYFAVFALAPLGWMPAVDDGIKTPEGFGNFVTVNGAILAVQAALLGLVFPLVIAFVGLLNQGRAAFASRLTIYVESSRAVFVGVSSLLLCVAIATQLFFASRMIENAAIIATGLNLSWFIVNVFALAYFVLHTIAFLHPSKRAPLVRRYVANVVWPRELSALIQRNRWANAAAYGYLPEGENDGREDGDNEARVWYALWESGEPQVVRRLHRSERLADIRFDMLAAIVSHWLDAAKSLEGPAVQDLAFPLQPGRDYEGEQVLARATHRLGRIERWGIWAAYKFTRVPDDHGALSETGELLRELITDLIVLIDGRQAGEFSTQLSEVIEFHTFLYQLAQLKDEDLNYAQFQDDWFGRNLGEIWTQAYRDMVARAVERIPEEPEFVGRTAYIAAHVYRRLANDVTPEALTPLLLFANHIAYRLTEWAVGEHLDENTGSDGKAQAFILVRRGEVYSRAWRDFVGAWERLLENVVSPSSRREKEQAWSDFQRFAGNATKHLELTTQMAARAIWVQDLLATNWACDLLLHWKTKIEREWEDRWTTSTVQSEMWTLDTLNDDWPIVENSQASTALPQQLTASAAFSRIMHNVWRDHVVTLASVSIHWILYRSVGEAAAKAARMLLRGEMHDSGDTGHRSPQPLSGNDILTSVLRIVGSGGPFADHSYAGRFEHLLENLGSLGENPGVSMRIYSSGGGFSFDALPTSHAIALMATIDRKASIDGNLRRLLTDLNDEALRRREEYLTKLLAAFDEIDGDRHATKFATLFDDTQELSFQDRYDRAKEFVTQSINVVINHRVAAITDAEVDPERLHDIASAASSRAFATDTFPLNLFASIDATIAELTGFTLRVNGVSKGAYTDPPMAVAVSNEEEWWRDSMSQKVAEVVWEDVLRAAKFEDVAGPTPETFWAAVRDGSARIQSAGYDPILIVGYGLEPPWLRGWRWPNNGDSQRKPADLVITQDASSAEGYVFSMNSTPVYQARTAYGVAYLVPAQLLERLRYHDYGNDLAIATEFEPDADNQWRGTMCATFQREVSLADLAAFRIRFTGDINAAPDGNVEPSEPTSPAKSRRRRRKPLARK